MYSREHKENIGLLWQSFHYWCSQAFFHCPKFVHVLPFLAGYVCKYCQVRLLDLYTYRFESRAYCEIWLLHHCYTRHCFFPARGIVSVLPSTVQNLYIYCRSRFPRLLRSVHHSSPRSCYASGLVLSDTTLILPVLPRLCQVLFPRLYTNCYSKILFKRRNHSPYRSCTVLL